MTDCRAVTYNISVSNFCESQLEFVVKWLSCNGSLWGVGPTALFASAAAVFLFSELQSTLIITDDNAPIPVLEKTLLTTMVLGLLALMVHVWVCSARFFQYYLDALIKESPNTFLEMTTAGFLGPSELIVLGPFTRFLRQQQPQVHITLCWFFSLCYADYVRKHYCQRFNMPYLEHWQREFHARASHAAHSTVHRVQSLVSALHVRLRAFTGPSPEPSGARPERTEMPSSNAPVGSCSQDCRMRGTEERRHSTGSLISQGPPDWTPLAGKSSETISAFDKLKAYVQATRCVCVTTDYQSQMMSGADIVKVEREIISKGKPEENSNNTISREGNGGNNSKTTKYTSQSVKDLASAITGSSKDPKDAETRAKYSNHTRTLSANPSTRGLRRPRSCNVFENASIDSIDL